MKGEIITLRGTPLDGLARVEDRGPLGGHRDLVLHLARIGPGKPEWSPLSGRGWLTQVGPDGRAWPIWRIPSERLDLNELRSRSRRPDLDRSSRANTATAFKITEASYGPNKNEIRTYSDPSHFAWAVIDSVSWAEANQLRAAESGRRPVRGALVIFDPVLALVGNQLWRGDQPWTVCRDDV